MALAFYPDAAQPVELPLGHDPDTLEASGDDAVALYLVTGDPAKLTVPEGATWVTVRALTTEEMRLAGKRAGLAPALGAVIHDQVAEVEQKARDEAAPGVLTDEERALAAEWLQSGEGEGQALTEKLGEAVGKAEREARARYLQTLPEQERQAWEDYREWEARRESEMVALGWVGARGGGWEAVPQDRLLYTLDHLVRPLSLRERIREELAIHIRRLSVLPPEGKE